MAKVAWVFPGQGSQAVGMGRDLYENFASAKAIFDQADEALGFPLSKLCFEGPEETLTQTINAQPALVTGSFACLEAVKESGASLPEPAFMAGHSLGEYTALAVAGACDFTAAVRLARERGRLMHEAGQMRQGTMAAILGMDQASLAEVCKQTDTVIANINCPGQIVISGSVDGVLKAMEMAREKGASKAIQLAVSGAFHSPLMQPAVEGMTQYVGSVDFKDPSVPVIGNTTAKPLSGAAAVRPELLDQLTSPVLWQQSVEYMIASGVTTFIEIGPGRVLAGLVKRISKEAETININNLEAVKALKG